MLRESVELSEEGDKTGEMSTGDRFSCSRVFLLLPLAIPSLLPLGLL